MHWNIIYIYIHIYIDHMSKLCFGGPFSVMVSGGLLAIFSMKPGLTIESRLAYIFRDPSIGLYMIISKTESIIELIIQKSAFSIITNGLWTNRGSRRVFHPGTHHQKLGISQPPWRKLGARDLLPWHILWPSLLWTILDLGSTITHHHHDGWVGGHKKSHGDRNRWGMTGYELPRKIWYK